jgi:hypothetical protein
MKIGDGTTIWSLLPFLTAAASAGGETGYVQINTAGSIDGDAQFTYDSTTNTLHISGAVSGTVIYGDTVNGGWSGSQIKSQYIEDYIASSSVLQFFYPSSLGKGISGALYTHVNDTTIHFTQESILDDFYPSSAGKSLSGATLPVLTWFIASSSKLSESGSKYTDSYIWYNTSSNLYSNWLSSGEKLSRWFKESSQKLGELASSGSNNWDSWKWYNTSSNLFSNWLASGEKLSRWFSESSSKLSDISGSLNTKINTKQDILNQSEYYPSSLGKQVSSQVAIAYASAQKAIYDAGTGDITHEQAEGWYYPSSLGRQVSSQVTKAYASAQLAIYDAGAGDITHEQAEGWYYPSSLGNIISSNYFKSGVAQINMLSDVDTQTIAPTRDYVLKWNGTNWVPALYTATFVFSILSFSDGESTTQLIGTGVWKAQSTMTYAATYTNGPPDEAWVQYSNNGGAYSKIATMTGPAYTAGTNDVAAINYPAAKDQYHRFRLSANCSTDTDSELETSIYFRNNIKHGPTADASGWDTDDINALAGTSLSATYTGGFAVNASAGGAYVLFAHPSTYTSLHVSGMIFNSVMCPFEEPTTVSVTNTAGYVENYKVYRSTLPTLGNSTLTTSTSDTRINKIYYGVASKETGFSEADIEGLATGTVSNTKGRTFSVTPGVGEFIVYSLPVRLGTVTFTVGGFEGGFNAPETVSVTNVNGHVENYYVYSSENDNLGSSSVVVT